MDKNYFESICKNICSNSKISHFKISEIEKNTIQLNSEKSSYEINYQSEKKQINLLKLDNSLKEIISSWYLDSESCTQKDISLISADFIESIVGQGKTTKSQYKKKTNLPNENNVTGIFFANRMMSIFPELKEEIQTEKQKYSEFRSSIFAVEHILPKIQQLTSENNDKTKLIKLSKSINDLYKNGSLDVRSIITMGILNGIEDESARNNLKSLLNADVNKAWDAASKYKGKRIKPEKIKNRKSLLSKAIEAQKLQ